MEKQLPPKSSKPTPKNEISFRPLTEGLGFHPFSDGLPYAPVNPSNKSAGQASGPNPRLSNGTGAVAAGAPRFNTQAIRNSGPRVSVPIADRAAHSPLSKPESTPGSLLGT